MFLGLVIYLAGRRYLPPEPQRLAPPVAAVQGARASHRRIWWLLLGVGIAATIFRGAYEQIGNTLPLWIDTGVDRVLLGFTIPMTWFQSLNPLLVISMTPLLRSEEHTSELQSLMRISYAVFCLKKKKNKKNEY